MYYNKIPNHLRGKPVDVIFRHTDADHLIVPKKGCIACNCILDKNAVDCSRCRSRALRDEFWIVSCLYRTGNCKTNRWGCSVHFGAQQSNSHGPVCTCDTCM